MMPIWGFPMMLLMVVFWVAVIWGCVAISRGRFRRPLTERPAAGEPVEGTGRELPANPNLLASDAERREVVVALEQHARDGRLTMAEFDDRSARAWAARTAGELAEITDDLPPADGR